MNFADLVPFIPAALLIFAAGIVGFYLGQAIERARKTEDRIRIEAFKTNFEMDSARLKDTANSIKNMANEIYTGLDRAERTVRSGKNESVE